MKKVDLFLGSDLGSWVLEQVSPESTGCIITLDQSIADIAREKKHRVLFGDIHQMAYDPSELGISVHYRQVLKALFISRYKKIYNLHPGYLPWGRGYFPVFWALWEDAPAGATLHEITAGLDKGPIVMQKEVFYTEEDTGYSLFQRVREAEKEIFLSAWRRIQNEEVLPAIPQEGKGTYHSKKEFVEFRDSFDWHGKTTDELIKLLRCLSFPEYPGMKVIFGKKTFELILRPGNQ